MRPSKIVSFSVVILLISVVFAGAVTVSAAAQYDTMQFRYNSAHTGDYSPVAGSVPSNGQLLWNYTTGGSVESSPAVANGVVYVGSWDSNLYAINASNGSRLWNYATGGSVESSPAVANGVVYAWGDYSNLYALNATTGANVWSYNIGGNVYFSPVSSPAVANGVVYVGSIGQYNGGGFVNAGVYALNATTGAKVWNYTTGGSVHSSPAVANGVVYVGSFDNNVYALNATTGANVWTFTTGGNVESSPAVANGVVYVGSDDGNLYALNATTGTQLWNYTTGGGPSSPAVANGVVYVGSWDGNVYAINASNGSKLWNYTTGSAVWSSPAVANGVVYVGSIGQFANRGFVNADVYALNASTGTQLWNYTTGNEVLSSPAVVNGVVYVGSFDNNVYAIGNRTTTLTATAPSTASVNQNFTINGTLSGSTFALAGATLTLQRSTDNVTFTNVSMNVTNTTGGYAFSKNESAAGTYYYRAAYAGNASYNNATSNVVKVSVTAPATTGNLLLNTHLVSTTTGSPPKIVTTYTFSGQLMTTSWTPVANAAITLQSSADKVHWSAFASPVKTNAQGAYTFKGTLKPGSYYFRTFFAGTSSTGPTASRIVRVVLSLNGSSSVSTVVA
jgi:outer membrane protein assembly factor BamB